MEVYYTMLSSRNPSLSTLFWNFCEERPPHKYMGHIGNALHSNKFELHESHSCGFRPSAVYKFLFMDSLLHSLEIKVALNA